MLQPEDPAPEFELPDQNGNSVKLSDALDQTLVLLYPVPIRSHAVKAGPQPSSTSGQSQRLSASRIDRSYREAGNFDNSR